MPVKYTVNAHSSLKIETDRVIYFDPFMIKEPVNDADIIFFTHSHYDHMSPEDVAKVYKSETVYVAPAGDENEVRKMGIPADRIVLMQPGEKTEVLGIPVTAVAAYNKLKPFHPKAKGWLGYAVELEGKTYYVCGDTDHTQEAESVECDVVFVPIGGNFTMGANRAAAFVNALKPGTAVPFHYGSIVGSADDFEKFASLVDSSVIIERQI